jgi:DNA (cytosine-5)-methyltransferase 1
MVSRVSQARGEWPSSGERRSSGDPKAPARNSLRFVDLFAGLGGFHVALRKLGHVCTFASEIDPDLQSIYRENFPEVDVHGDIRECKLKIPSHDILCAGFPCQPFSKSGAQRGLRDKTRGTLFHEILEVLERHKPMYAILENVGNFERHDGGRTWQIVRDSLSSLDYDVRGTEHVASGGRGLLSPHHLGFPHTRGRFFIVASRSGLPLAPFPEYNRNRQTSLGKIVLSREQLSAQDLRETSLSIQQVRCIDHWNELVRTLPSSVELPSFPIWGDEINASYPFEKRTPFTCRGIDLSRHLGQRPRKGRVAKEELLARLPSYARTQTRSFPVWKVRFIKQNRDWFRSITADLSPDWITRLREFPPSLRKLEWNCHGEERDLWKYVLQFRPSGLRAKRYTSCPALVAMTTTQIPILGPERRFLARREGLSLQGFRLDHCLPESRAAAFTALGNAVHAGVVEAIARRLVTT